MPLPTSPPPRAPAPDAFLLPDPAGRALHGALLESRQRWRDFVMLAADLVFETDAEGRLVFLAPDRVLGWPAEQLLNRPGTELLLQGGPDPFALHAAVRGMKAWLRRAPGGCGGEPACFSFSVVPLLRPQGGFLGLRGCGHDVTEEERAEESRAALLRRAGALEALVHRVRKEVLAPRMLAAALEALPATLGCAGAVVLQYAPGMPPQPVHRFGADPGVLLAFLSRAGATPAYGRGPAGEPFVLLPPPQHSQPRHALLAWRAAGAREFDADDRHLLLSLADLVFVALGNQTLQQELEQQARTEALTGLLNRRAFLADLRRRLERLDTDSAAGRPSEGGALLFLDLDNFKPVNDLLGHEAGDAALVAVGNLLRDSVRPTDLVARIGGDEFALWLDGVNEATAAARAQAILAATATLPALLRTAPTALGFSIGCALYRPGGGDRPETLLARADATMYAAKRAGRGCWRVAEATA